MWRLLSFGILLSLVGGHVLQAVNPEDIQFQARLVKNTVVYHTGESIQLEISYTSQSDKKYSGSFSAPSPEVEGVIPRVTPLYGVVDLSELRRDSGAGWAGSSIAGLGYLGAEPVKQQLDLCRWYRFQKPGHYSVTFISHEVSRVRNVEEGGGPEPLTLESDPVEFDILPADDAWLAGELSDIRQALNTATNAGEYQLALGRLSLLDTPASVQMLIQLYLSSSKGAEEWIFESALRESSQPETIVPLLKAALSNPAVNVPSGLPGLLATLETRKQLGISPAYPTDAAKQQKWSEEFKERSRVRDKYLEQADALLMAGMGERAGPRRATAIYQTWFDATRLNAPKASPEVLSALAYKVLAVANDLDHDRQVQFMILAWQTLPHEQLLPLIRSMAEAGLNRRDPYDTHEALRLWYEGWLEECNAAILQNVLLSKGNTDRNVSLLMSEAEHPELDTMLEARLKDSATLQDFARSQRLAAVVLRAGSRNVSIPRQSRGL